MPDPRIFWLSLKQALPAFERSLLFDLRAPLDERPALQQDTPLVFLFSGSAYHVGPGARVLGNRGARQSVGPNLSRPQSVSRQQAWPASRVWSFAGYLKDSLDSSGNAPGEMRRLHCLIALMLTMVLSACSGGGSGSGGTAAAPPETATLSLKIEVPQLRAEKQRLEPSLVEVRVVASTAPDRDLVSATLVPVSQQQQRVQVGIRGVPVVPCRILGRLLDIQGHELATASTGEVQLVAGLNDITLDFNSSPPPPPPPGQQSLVFQTQPAGTLVNQAITPPVQVAVTDSSGLVVSMNAPITLSLANNPAAATLSGTLTVNAVNGVATFSDLSLNQVANGYTLQATASGITAATSSAFNIASSVAPPARVAFQAQPVDTVAGQPVPAVQVAILDTNGIVVTTSGAPVTLAINSNPGASTLSGTLTVNAVNGVATFNNLSLSQPGVGYTLLATSTGLADDVSSAFTILSPFGPPNRLAFLTQPISSQARQPLNSFQVEIQDAAGVRVLTASDPVTISLSNNPGPATLSGVLTVNAVNGVATFTGNELSRSGIGFTLNAASGALTPVVSNAFNQSLPHGMLVDVPGSPFAGAVRPTRGAMDSGGNHLYVGTFTPGSPNVYGFNVNPDGSLPSQIAGSPFAATNQPGGGIAVSPDDLFAYASNSNLAVNAISRFSRNPATGALANLGADQPAGGLNPVDLIVRPGPVPFLYVSSLASNVVGQFSAVAGAVTPIGTPEPTPFGSIYTRLHPANNNFLYDSSGRFFSINPATGVLAPIANYSVAFGRGMDVGRVNNRLYRGNGVGPPGSTIEVYDIPPATGIPALVANNGIPEIAADIVVSADESTLYMCNTTGNIRIFEILPDGALDEFGESPIVTAGSSEIDFIRDPQNRFLYVTNGATNLIYGFTFVP